jgi:hypothetical protein
MTYKGTVVGERGKLSSHSFVYEDVQIGEGIGPRSGDAKGNDRGVPRVRRDGSGAGSCRRDVRDGEPAPAECWIAAGCPRTWSSGPRAGQGG